MLLYVFRSIIPVYFQKKVYQFLRHTFKHWGMDRTFRIVCGIVCVCVCVCVCVHMCVWMDVCGHVYCVRVCALVCGV